MCWQNIFRVDSVSAYHLRMADLAPFSHQGPRRFCEPQEAAGVQQRLQSNLEYLMLVSNCFSAHRKRISYRDLSPTTGLGVSKP